MPMPDPRQAIIGYLFIVIWPLRNIIWLTLNHNTKMYMRENEYENIVCKIVAVRVALRL